MANWSAKALLITAGVFLVGGAVWYARAATVPLIVAALISTQLLPLVDWAGRRGVSRGLAIAGSMIGVVLIVAGLAWVFSDSWLNALPGSIATTSDLAGTSLRDRSKGNLPHQGTKRKTLPACASEGLPQAGLCGPIS